MAEIVIEVIYDIRPSIYTSNAILLLSNVFFYKGEFCILSVNSVQQGKG